MHCDYDQPWTLREELAYLCIFPLVFICYLCYELTSRWRK